MHQDQRRTRMWCQRTRRRRWVSFQSALQLYGTSQPSRVFCCRPWPDVPSWGGSWRCRFPWCQVQWIQISRSMQWCSLTWEFLWWWKCPAQQLPPSWRFPDDRWGHEQHGLEELAITSCSWLQALLCHCCCCCDWRHFSLDSCEDV